MVSLKEKLDPTYKIPKNMLRIMGSFPQENGEFKMRNLYFTNIYSVYIIVVAFTEVCSAWPNVTDILISLGLLCSAIAGFLKFFSYTKNRKLLFELLVKIREDFWNENIGCVLKSETVLVKKYANQVYKFTVLLSANTCFCGGLKLLKAFIFMYIKPDPENPGERILPIDTSVPFIDIFANPYYQIIYAAEIFGMLYTMFIYASMDCFIPFFIINVTCQYRILKDRIENINNYQIYKTEAKSPEEFLKICIKRHQELNKISKDLNTVFNLPMLAEFLVACPFLCLSCFVMLRKNLHTYYYVEYYVSLFATIVELFAYCFPADKLTEQAVKVAQAAYFSDWLFAAQSMKKMILMMIHRSQREIYITAGNFQPVTVQTFQTIIRSAMSYFTFLSAVTSEN